MPEQISMTYWFIKSQPRTQSLTFTYDRLQHEKTQEDLTKLLSQLTGWRHRYQSDRIPFPQVSVSANRCLNCSFAVRCQRIGEMGANSSQLVPNLADIEEVSL